jgi:hypothetical protein
VIEFVGSETMSAPAAKPLSPSYTGVSFMPQIVQLPGASDLIHGASDFGSKILRLLEVSMGLDAAPCRAANQPPARRALP